MEASTQRPSKNYNNITYNYNSHFQHATLSMFTFMKREFVFHLTRRNVELLGDIKGSIAIDVSQKRQSQDIYQSQSI